MWKNRLLCSPFLHIAFPPLLMVVSVLSICAISCFFVPQRRTWNWTWFWGAPGVKMKKENHAVSWSNLCGCLVNNSSFINELATLRANMKRFRHTACCVHSPFLAKNFVQLFPFLLLCFFSLLDWFYYFFNDMIKVHLSPQQHQHSTVNKLIFVRCPPYCGTGLTVYS